MTTPATPQPADRAALRDRIRRAICEAEGFGYAWGTDMLEPDEYGEQADAVLAVLPEHADRAAVLREAAVVRTAALREAEAKAREIVAKLWGDGTTQTQLDRAGAARAVEWEIGLMASGINEPAPDFFQPGHSYTHRDGSTFRCVADTTHPDGGDRVAIGWHTDTAGWTFVGVRNNNHWNHEYDGVQPPSDGQRRLADEAEAGTAKTRCPSCDHKAKYHDVDGKCWFTVERGMPGSNLVCPCVAARMADEAEAAR